MTSRHKADRRAILIVFPRFPQAELDDVSEVNTIVNIFSTSQFYTFTNSLTPELMEPGGSIPH